MGQLIYRTSRDVKRSWWQKALIKSKKDRAETGITVAEWCKQYNVSEKSYWYYHKQFGDELALAISEQQLEESLTPMPVNCSAKNDIEFAELPVTIEKTKSENKISTAVICKGDMRIEISEEITDEFLFRIMRAAYHA